MLCQYKIYSTIEPVLDILPPGLLAWQAHVTLLTFGVQWFTSVQFSDQGNNAFSGEWHGMTVETIWARIRTQVLVSVCSTHLLHNNILETYLSRSNPSAIKVNQDTTQLALNSPQGHKHYSYPTSYQLTALNHQIKNILPLNIRHMEFVYI